MVISFQNLSTISLKTLSVLVLSSGVFGFASVPVKAASASKYMIVVEPRGVNIRNRNCQVIDSLGFGQVAMRAFDINNPPQSLTCSVGGQSLTMVKYKNLNGGNYDMDNSYIAIEYLAEIIMNESRSFDSKKASVISGQYGANLRDYRSCSRVAVAPKGTRMDANPNDNSVAICQVGREFYFMRQPVYQGKAYFVADILIDNI